MFIFTINFICIEINNLKKNTETFKSKAMFLFIFKRTSVLKWKQKLEWMFCWNGVFLVTSDFPVNDL